MLVGTAWLAAREDAKATPVGSSAVTYAACGRVFPDPHAYWPAPQQVEARSPFAKGDAACASQDFLQHQEMIDGANFLESLFPDFVEFYNLEKDFGDASDCATSSDPLDFCSAGLPRQGTSPERVRSDIYMLRVTDERVPDAGKKFFVFTLSIHGIERAGAEGGIRAAEDLATWAYCEAVGRGQSISQPAEGATVDCQAESPTPHPILETQPDSRSAGEILGGASVYFVFANPDGWRRGDVDNLARFYQRYNGNGVDLNRDWPSIGYVFRPYTPLSEPETRSIAKVLKSIRPKWDGGIDLHGQLVDRAFSFTMLAQGENDFGKNQRILQLAKGAWEDAEERLGWSPMIVSNDQEHSCIDVGVTLCDRMYGVQWGTVWDTIDYTTTGANSDWMNSELGLGADAMGNEMSFSHLINCGTGACYSSDIEQLHIDGNKSLIYGMLHFTFEPEDQAFRVPGRVAYINNPRKVTNPGKLITPPPTAGLDPQAPISDIVLGPDNGYTYGFDLKGPNQGVYNGGVEGRVTPLAQFGGISGSSLWSLVLERFAGKGEDLDERAACGSEADGWIEINRYYNQSPGYLQSGQAVHANDPVPGFYRICLTGDFAEDPNVGATWDLDVTFARESVWADPGQRAYSVSNMKFFTDLAKFMGEGQLTGVDSEHVLSGAVDLSKFTSVVIADDPFPGYTEPLEQGPSQASMAFEPPEKAATTVPCFYDPELGGVLLEACYAAYEFEVDPAFNNQQLLVALDYTRGSGWILEVERRRRDGSWARVGYSNTLSGHDEVRVLNPIDGAYRALIVNQGGGPLPSKLQISFSNVYAGPPRMPSTRSASDLGKWSDALKKFVEKGGNLVLTDGALRNLAYMGLVSNNAITRSDVYAGFISFTGDGQASTYEDPLAKDLDQPGAAEGPGFRHQTYEPVPLGFELPAGRDPFTGFSPLWSVEQQAWEKAGGRTVGVGEPQQVALGEMSLGKGVIRPIGALLPMPSDAYYHPFGLASYSVTYSGYQVLNNALQWPAGAVASPPPLASTGPAPGATGLLPFLAGVILMVLGIAIWVTLRRNAGMQQSY